MAWSSPRTWSPGETVTAALMNSHLRDNLNALSTKAIVVQLGAAGNGVISTGVKVFVEVPFACRVTGWTLVADAVGDIVVDVWKDTYANFPPLVADTIAGTEKPTLAAAQKNQDLSLSSWDTDIDAGDVLAFNVDSAATVQVATLTLRVQPL